MVTHILQERAHDNVIKTRTTIEEFCGLLGSEEYMVVSRDFDGEA